VLSGPSSVFSFFSSAGWLTSLRGLGPGPLVSISFSSGPSPLVGSSDVSGPSSLRSSSPVGTAPTEGSAPLVTALPEVSFEFEGAPRDAAAELPEGVSPVTLLPCGTPPWAVEAEGPVVVSFAPVVRSEPPVSPEVVFESVVPVVVFSSITDYDIRIRFCRVHFYNFRWLLRKTDHRCQHHKR
jgi:hypothetical protein